MWCPFRRHPWEIRLKEPKSKSSIKIRSRSSLRQFLSNKWSSRKIKMSSSLMLNMCRVMDNKMHCRRISTVWKRSRFNIMKATIKKSSHHSRPTTIIISTSSHSITTARHKCNRIAAIALHLLNNITRVPCRSSSSNITTPCHKL